MTESKARVLGCSGTPLDYGEIRPNRVERPWGFILFVGHVSAPDQTHDLIAAIRDPVGRPDAPVSIDQKGRYDTSMRVLSGDYPEKVATILAAGHDIVLHCDSMTEEMTGIISRTAMLDEKALERAERSLRYGKAAGLDAAFRTEFANDFEAVA